MGAWQAVKEMSVETGGSVADGTRSVWGAVKRLFTGRPPAEAQVSLPTTAAGMSADKVARTAQMRGLTAAAEQGTHQLSPAAAQAVEKLPMRARFSHLGDEVKGATKSLGQTLGKQGTRVNTAFKGMGKAGQVSVKFGGYATATGLGAKGLYDIFAKDPDGNRHVAKGFVETLGAAAMFAATRKLGR